MNPAARIDDLLLQEVDNELVVFDMDTCESHRLNQTAALVFLCCDGRTSVARIVDRVSAELGVMMPGPLVREALRRLSEANLLQVPVSFPFRPFIVAGSMAILVPVVESLLAPSPAAVGW